MAPVHSGPTVDQTFMDAILIYQTIICYYISKQIQHAQSLRSIALFFSRLLVIGYPISDNIEKTDNMHDNRHMLCASLMDIPNSSMDIHIWISLTPIIDSHRYP